MIDKLTYRIGYLQECCNKYGDFKVAIAFKKDDDIVWSKHRSVIECWHNDLMFLEEANNRQIFNHEVILDFDNITPTEKLELICNTIKDYGFPYKVYFSGSKGYHIHIKIPQLATMNKFARESVRKYITKRCGCDKQKSYDASMIAIENVPHWKTGKKKELIVEWGLKI